MKKVTIQIVTYNSEKDIIKCINSINQQTYRNIEVIVIDNNSTDKTVELLLNKYSNITLIINNKNLGFCKGHNIGFREGKGDYVIILNPDVILDKHFVEQVVKAMEGNPDVGLISGKILRMKQNFITTNIIDSTGIVMARNRRAYDRGQGEEDKGQYDEKNIIFGVCGAAAVYRRKMLEDVKIDNEYFDENFFAYKEDVDLSWRAKLFGWKCLYVPSAVAYHKRGWKESSRKEIPLFLRIHSIKNRYLTIIKNDNIISYLKDLPFILAFDIGIFVYCLFKEPKTLKYILCTIKLLPDTIKKRKQIKIKTKRLKELKNF
ncbi:glycosyltransferase family 2 protein [Caloranaerobacter azorensis]|uniref:Glycosyltransferase family 2 protein n=1 Tax=Caloranaerobacter azorensis TaxID=116090 RepID=A0A6P1YEQ7_9FIRM|nr:glycosyltransferase family 2 protein [Caloranaerobacter azorensis]QIB27577.1 glycosyltransferase family 2 protein [Caloranaerobacter azorensis]